LCDRQGRGQLGNVDGKIKQHARLERLLAGLSGFLSELNNVSFMTLAFPSR